ncbi:MAG: hypothetical protein J0L84_15520 [Verrucomicrobia bacterium]|nr:hypothetical protein [Verrucomicrobiota bacterium]
MPKNISSKVRRGVIRELEPAGTRLIRPDRFKADLKPGSLLELLGGGLAEFAFAPIETLTPARTAGKGRTNVTVIESTILQVDTTPPAPPFANFDLTQSQRRPAIQMHFEPSAYGMTSPATYIMEFMIAVVGTASFNVAAGPPGLNVSGLGTRSVSGNARVSVVFRK